MKVICTSCKQTFELKDDGLKEKSLGNGITEIYYACPLCNKEYRVCITNERARRMQRDIEELRATIRERRAKHIDISLQQKKILSMQKQYKKLLDKLNGRG